MRLEKWGGKGGRTRNAATNYSYKSVTIGHVMLILPTASTAHKASIAHVLSTSAPARKRLFTKGRCV